MSNIPSTRETELFAVMDEAYTKFKAADSYLQAARGQYTEMEMAHSLAYAQIEQERHTTWQAYCKAFNEWDREHEGNYISRDKEDHDRQQAEVRDLRGA